MDVRKRPLLSTALCMLVALHAAAFGADGRAAGPWAQWRGPEGLGVSSEPNLPESWSSDGLNIRWKTRLPGQGNSSPVVSNDRVILTTAYESPKAAAWRMFIDLLSLALVLFFLAAAVGGSLRKRKDASMGWFNSVFRWLTTLGFIFSALLVTVGRSRSGEVLAWVGRILAQWGFEDMEHLCSMDEGVRAAVWLTSGGIALLGLAVAVGWIKAQSIWRIIAAVAVLACSILLIKRTPTDQWMEQIEWGEKLAFILAGQITAFWHLINYFQIGYKQDFQPPAADTAEPRRCTARAVNALNHLEIRWRHKGVWGFGGFAAAASALSLAFLAALVFVPPNFAGPLMGHQRVVLCVDMETGDILWERPVFVASKERKHHDSTYAMPTAATDGKYIIVNFGVGVACLDFDGRILWRKDDPDYLRNTRYGAASSPVLTGDKAIVVQEREAYSDRATWIAAFDKETGREHWKIHPENIHECFSTPLLYRDDNGLQLLIASWGNIASYNTEDGMRLWVKMIPSEQLVASMARSHRLLCIGGGTWGPSHTIMMRLSSPGERPDAEIIWQSEEDPPGDCSPVIYDGKLFTISDRGKMTCYNAANGEILWNKRLRGSRYLSSLVAGDGKVYASNTKGLTTVIAADAEFKVLAENDLGGRCHASPAIADGCILMRVGNHLYCIENRDQ